MSEHTAISKSLFSENSDTLPEVFVKHYGNRIGCTDEITAKGTLDIWRSPLMKPISFLFRWSKTLVPVTATNAPATVVFRTRADATCFWFDRRISLRNGGIMAFVSRMEIMGSNEVIEWTGSGIGWKCTYAYAEGRVLLHHQGYRLRIGNLILPLPVEWLLGCPSAWEEAIDHANFRMEMKVSHKLFGTLYSYAGQFEITEISLAK